MYSDLFDHLGTNAGGGAGGSTSSNSNEKQLVSFKAGKMEMTLQENGKYWSSPDTRRGEIRIVWKTTESTLYWEWFDRREKTVAEDDKHVLWSVGGTAAAGACGTMEKVTNAPNPADQDRLYVWSRPQAGSEAPSYHMYWLQDASLEHDDELIAKVNQYLADPASANPTAAGSTSGGDRAAASSSSSSGNATGGTDASSSSTDRQQVDALSNILENLGMPQGDSSASSPASASGGAAAATSSDGAAATGTLTLADLQGAMAGVQQGGAGQPGPPLQELVTPAAVSALLENEEVKARLLELLPEEQRSEEFLEENLRSPQVQQTLRSLTAALMPDDTGSMDGFHSVLANFGMVEGAQESLQSNSNNPIQAFLDCVLKSVEKESKKDEEESKEE